MTDEVLAVDIGGTKMAVARVRRDGAVLAEQVRPTGTEPDADAVFAGLAEALATIGTELPADDAPVRVGISSAGPIDGPAGTVSPVNIHAWRRFPLVDRVRAVVEQTTGRAASVGLAGDAHCIALGEYWLGAGRDVRSMIGMVLSTGVGGGAVIEDELYSGTSGNGVFFGHTSVNAWGPRCVCGAPGCVELYARGPALVAAAKAAGWLGGDDARDLTADARAGDEIALASIDYGMRALAAGIAATAITLDVSVVVMGGGVSKAGEVVFGPLRRHLRDFTTLDFVADLQLRPAELENGGLLGAAALAFRQGVDRAPAAVRPG